MADSDPPRFVSDAMVGKLARWLRLTGEDVLFNASWDDPELLAIARREGRVLLTRDVPLASGSGDPRRLLVESDDFREQLVQVVTTYGLESLETTLQPAVWTATRLSGQPSERKLVTRCLLTCFPLRMASNGVSTATRFFGMAHIATTCSACSENCSRPTQSSSDTKT